MKTHILIGMVAGGLIGAAAAIIAYPYMKPHIDSVLTNGKACIDTHIDRMLGCCTNAE